MNHLTSEVQAFEARATDTDLDDLRTRLAAARLPEAETVCRAAPGAGRWEQGVPLADLIDVVNYWRTEYDWRSFEARLNKIGQFRTTIDGLGIHFLHRRSTRQDAIPLIMTHGWPGSIAEFVHNIDELADPKDRNAPAFHVVTPSLPGFGYSDRPTATGWGTEKIAAAWVDLMGRLGYGKFAAHGGDWGGVITAILGSRFPEQVLGLHTTLAQAPPGLTADGLTAIEREWTEETRDFWRHRAAYAKQQATRPQTIGYSLVDSPVGLLAWILDKFSEWTDTEDSPFETISRDRILDNVTLYWLTQTGASAARIYYESHNSLDPELRIDVPSAISVYPRDIEKCPRAWAQERYRQIVRWRSPETGGHFPSLEVPEHFVRDLQEGLAAVLAASAAVGHNIRNRRRCEGNACRAHPSHRHPPIVPESGTWPCFSEWSKSDTKPASRTYPRRQFDHHAPDDYSR
ncbi:epoxide hydrolase family protein [Aestuariispira ectoiniformans]|uniref:epoxide hydrolase family protein n=1 Tax=Aestuariispira ectoiniformans TaxID=2775080 RepID=UPI00223A8CBD|nr:epoxide hydrolase [Aestuariispira ectoiniformans]